MKDGAPQLAASLRQMMRLPGTGSAACERHRPRRWRRQRQQRRQQRNTHAPRRRESVLHTLYTTYVQGSLVGKGHDLRFSVCRAFFPPRLSVSFALLSALFALFFFFSLFFLHITLRLLLSRSLFPQKLSCKASDLCVCVISSQEEKKLLCMPFLFSFSFRCDFSFGVVLLFPLDLHMLLFSSSSILSPFPSLFLSPLPG